MSRDRPPSNWSGSANSEHGFEGHGFDSWSPDDRTHGSHVSESGMPDVSSAGPETNAFLWALEGEPEELVKAPAQQFRNGAPQDADQTPDEYFAPFRGQPNHVEYNDEYYPSPIEQSPPNGSQNGNTGYPQSYEEEPQYLATPEPTHPQTFAPSPSRGGFDEEDEPDFNESFHPIQDYDQPTTPGFFEPDEEAFDDGPSGGLENLVHPDNRAPRHRSDDSWLNQPSNGLSLRQDRTAGQFAPGVTDYRSGIERDTISNRPSRVNFPPTNYDEGYDGYSDDYGGYNRDYDEPVEELPRRKVRRRRRQSDKGYVVENKTKGHRVRDQVIEVMFLVIPAVILVLLVRSFVVSPFVIPTSSMEPTLEVQDRVLVNKLSYRVGEIGRGDIVVVRAASDDGDKTVIKRAIGLPGETVEIRDNSVIINGTLALEESDYLPEGTINGDFGPIEIPQDKLFLLGDNRENSDDSTKELGLVSVDDVVGRAFVRFWPVDRFGLL